MGFNRTWIVVLFLFIPLISGCLFNDKNGIITYSGYVYDEDTGKPIPDCEILIEKYELDWCETLGKTTTNKFGYYQISVPEFDEEGYENKPHLRIIHEQYFGTYIGSKEKRRDMIIELQRGIRIHGRLNGTDNYKSANFFICITTVSRDDFVYQDFTSPFYSSDWLWGSEALVIPVNNQGIFSSPLLLDGDYKLNVNSDELSPLGWSDIVNPENDQIINLNLGLEVAKVRLQINRSYGPIIIKNGSTLIGGCVDYELSPIIIGLPQYGNYTLTTSHFKDGNEYFCRPHDISINQDFQFVDHYVFITGWEDE